MARTLFEYHKLRDAEAKNWDRASLERAIRAQAVSRLEELDTAILLSAQAYLVEDGSLCRDEPSPLDARCAELCALYFSQTSEARAYIRANISRAHGATLIGFSTHAAIFGERGHSAEWVRHALVAHAIEDLAAGDARDNLVAVTLVHHCAERIGLPVEELFREIAGVSGPPIAALLLDYLERSPAERSLQVMGWREVRGEGEVEYRPGRIT